MFEKNQNSPAKKFWFIADTTGCLMSEYDKDSSWLKALKGHGNFFKTRKQAREVAAEIRKVFKKYQKKFNK